MHKPKCNREAGTAGCNSKLKTRQMEENENGKTKGESSSYFCEFEQAELCFEFKVFVV